MLSVSITIHYALYSLNCLSLNLFNLSFLNVFCDLDVVSQFGAT